MKGYRTTGNIAKAVLCGLMLILGLTAVQPAAAAIAYVQGAGLNRNSGSSVSVTFSAAQTAGNFNVVVVAWDDTTSTVTSITDTDGNAYVQAGTSTTISGTVTQQVYYATNIGAAAAGSNTVTVVYSKSVTYPEVKIAEYSGISTTSPFDGMASGTGTGTAIITGSLTTTNANDLLLASDVIWGNRTQGGKIHGRGSRVFNSLRSPIPISLGTSMAYGFCGRRQRAVLRSAQPGRPVAGQGWHTGKTVF